jgi:hypothetical protein
MVSSLLTISSAAAREPARNQRLTLQRVAKLTVNTMADAASDIVVKNLIEALTRLQDDLDRVEIWTAALICFQEPVPDYLPGGDFLLPHRNDINAGKP